MTGLTNFRKSCHVMWRSSSHQLQLQVRVEFAEHLYETIAPVGTSVGHSNEQSPVDIISFRGVSRLFYISGRSG